MEVFPLFRASLYLLVAVAGLMLGYAEGGLSPQWLLPIVVFAAWYLTDHQQRFLLPVPVAGILGLIAFSLAIGEILAGDIEARILSGAHLVVYLTSIVLFLRKSESIHWILLAFCLLMVSLGAVLADNSTYGMQLVFFLMLATWTLALNSLHNAQQRFKQAETSGLRVELTGADFHLQPELVDQDSQARGSIQRDPTENWINFRFVLGWLGSVAGILVLASGFFLFIPRFWIGSGQFTDRDLGPVEKLTGFASEISLGQIGSILESTKPVFRLEVTDGGTGEPVDLDAYASLLGYDEPLFRGTVLNEYEGGKWSLDQRRSETTRMPAEPGYTNNLVRHRYKLEPGNEDVIFALQPCLAAQMTDPQGRIIFERGTGRLLRPPSLSNRRVTTYEAWTINLDRQQADRPVIRIRRAPGADRWFDDLYLSFPEEKLPRVRKLTEQVLQDKFGEGDVRVVGRFRNRMLQIGDRDVSFPEAMATIERYLSSGTFGYTLDQTISDPSIDPVEDFLFNRKQGHCEYFASAMALMLRSVGIPSRLVSGFKGSMPLDYGEGYEVQQRHAHAWVEGWSYDEMAWHVMDPTPGQARSDSVDEIEEGESIFAALSRTISDFWNGNITSLTLSQQRRRFYLPIRDFIVETWNALKGDPTKLKEKLRDIGRFLLSPEKWISLEGGVFTFVFLLFMAGMIWIGKRIWRLFRKWFRTEERRRQRSEVAFYEQFRKLCASLGQFRRRNETQEEFANRVTSHLQDELGKTSLEEFPSRLVNAFYRVRFGQDVLSSTELDELTSELDRFAVMLEQKEDTDSASAA